jgi:CYTH domain-containing protein
LLPVKTLPTGNISKYARIEIERRWLVDLTSVGSLERAPSKTIEDRYILGTQLRLRKFTGPGARIEYKFGKKYGKQSLWSEPIANLYLEEQEYQLLANLPARSARKRRFSIAGGSLDVYENPNAGMAIFEVEFESEMAASSYSPPAFVIREVTGDPQFSGATLTMPHEV